MEVTTEEEAQAVLLEGMEGSQYITIQRTDGEGLTKTVPLFAFNGEVFADGLVVDMMNDVGSDYSTSTQYYETEDLMPHVLTEEDRRLAAALVAVQLQQQQKQQQIHNHSNPDDPTLQDVTQLDTTLPPVNAYAIETIQEQNPPPVYPSLQTFKRGIQNVKEEFINIKCEDDVDISAESSEDAVPIPGSKRSLPHKKRIPRKLKQQSKRNIVKRENSRSNQEAVVTDSITKVQGNAFKCELCGNKFSGQLKFFEHLKSHYEPVKEERRIASQPVNNNLTIALPNIPESSVQGVVENTIEEFSEPEDIMEGIRDVVEETGAHIDDEDSSSIWTITEVATEHIEQEEIEEPPTSINQEDLFEKEKAKTSDSVKKKKPKSKKSTDELTCPNCDRSFHHKNSLVYHMRSHSGERPHQCEVCGKSFFAASALKVHKRLHSGDKPYKCEDCGRHFRQWGDLKYHSTSLHSEQRQFQCEYCGKDFARKYSLIVHRRIHTGEKNYRCEYCNKTFRASSYLQNHRRIHTGEKPHPCIVCGKPFRVRSDMKRHMLTHTRTANRPDRVQTKNAAIIKTQTNGENSSDEDRMNKTSRTINEIVHELKLEVDPNTAVIELVGSVTPSDENSESILPHVNVQSLEYATVTGTQVEAESPGESVHERDPLEAEVARSSDVLNFDMQLYSINL